MVTISISNPYSISRYKFMVSKVILVKDHGYSDSDVRPYASVKDYSFGGSDILPYVRMFVRPHEGPFQHQLQLVYYSITPSVAPCMSIFIQWYFHQNPLLFSKQCLCHHTRKVKVIRNVISEKSTHCNRLPHCMI